MSAATAAAPPTTPTVKTLMVEVGLRVVRGRDWKWIDQDGGEGHVGTVVEIGQLGGSATPDKTVVVQWDSNSRTNYRVGYQMAYDLRIFDNAPVGVRHTNIICDGCRKHGIIGMLWKCARCHDFDLCTQCYMGDKHDLSHAFLRFETVSSIGVEMPIRQTSAKVQAKGVFVGAKVVRGPDWDWALQDGGEGKIGRVIDIRGWDNESGRSVANVTWASGSTNVYRLGHKGKVDLRAVTDASGGFYYRDHLPLLGEPIEQLQHAYPSHHLTKSGAATATSSPSRAATQNQNGGFTVGEKVRISVDLETLKRLQHGHGGWNPLISDCLMKVGTVHRVTDKSDIRVHFHGVPNRWTIHPSALSKLPQFAIGDHVIISDDVTKVRELQKGHGEWVDRMMNLLGKRAEVLQVYPDNDLQLKVDEVTLTMNPCCVIPSSNASVARRPSQLLNPDQNNTMGGSQHASREYPSPIAAMLSTLTEQQLVIDAVDVNEGFLQKAAQGNLEMVKFFIQKHPERVDCQSLGKTALHVSCHQGHMEVVKLLLDSGANVEIADDDGDTAIHYAAFGNQPAVMEYLDQRGSNLNATNKAKCTAMHVAVNKQHVECARRLLGFGCDVNKRDSYGDTALHDAISKENAPIVDMLVNANTADLSLRNKRGFNVLHHAALKGNNEAVEQILTKSRQLADVKKEDGFTALHLASLNGHLQVVQSLITIGQCSIEIANNRRQTALMLAISQSHLSIIELLMSKSANLSAVDEDGNTPCHLAVNQLMSTLGPNDSPTPPSPSGGLVPYQPSVVNNPVGNFENAPNINTIYQRLIAGGYPNTFHLAVVCFLSKYRADFIKKNNQGQSCLDMLAGLAQIIEIVRSYAVIRIEFPRSLVRREQPVVVDQVSTAPVSTESQSNVSPTVAPPIEPSMARDTKPISCESKPQAQAAQPNDEIEEQRLFAECMVCCDTPPTIKFEPCGHVVVCEGCCQRMKKCLVCRAVIERKIPTGERASVSKSACSDSTGDIDDLRRVHMLETKLQELEEATACSICMEGRRSVVFMCGHTACAVCAGTLRICHMCRKPISRKINIY